MDGEAWWAKVHGVAKSWTGLSDEHTKTACISDGVATTCDFNGLRMAGLHSILESGAGEGKEECVCVCVCVCVCGVCVVWFSGQSFAYMDLCLPFWNEACEDPRPPFCLFFQPVFTLLCQHPCGSRQRHSIVYFGLVPFLIGAANPHFSDHLCLRVIGSGHTALSGNSILGKEMRSTFSTLWYLQWALCPPV